MKTFLIVAFALVATTVATPQASAICVDINEDFRVEDIDAHIDTQNPTNSYVTIGSNGPLATIRQGSC